MHESRKEPGHERGGGVSDNGGPPWAEHASLRLMGYTDQRCDHPGGQFHNWITLRAMVVRADGSGRAELAPGLCQKPDTWTQHAGWSPDGRRAIVCSAWEDPENAAWEHEHRTFRMTEGWLLDCSLVDLATGQVANVTAVERVSIYNGGLFFWPGDPTRLGFTALVGAESHPFSMDIDGRNKKDLTTGKRGFTYGYSASPDGKRISYHKDYQLWVADADGSNAQHIDTGNPFDFAPCWSPDGQWLAFVSGEHRDCHPHLVRADGAELRKLADRGGYGGEVEVLDYPDFHSGSSDTVSWSADSRWIYYSAKVGQAIELMRVSVEGSIEQLTHSRPGVLHYHVRSSPDGRWIAFGSTRDGARALYVALPDGSDANPVTTPTPGRAQMHANWQPLAGDCAEA